MTDTVVEQAETYWAQIYIAGDLGQAKQVCREECMRQGLCVTVAGTSFIYTGGEEDGIVVGLINYPRFPSEHTELFARAERLGHLLMERLCQRSFSISTPTRTIRYSRKSEGSAQ